VIEKFVIQTQADYAKIEPDPSTNLLAERPTTQHYLTLHGPFADEQAALHYIKDLHFAGRATGNTWEYIIDAQPVEAELKVQLMQEYDES